MVQSRASGRDCISKFIKRCETKFVSLFLLIFSDIRVT